MRNQEPLYARFRCLLPAYTETCTLGCVVKRQQKRTSGWDASSVRALRRHMKLSQEELAAQLGTRQQTVSEWETGRYRPRGASATLLAIIAERAEFEYGTGNEKGEMGRDETD